MKQHGYVYLMYLPSRGIYKIGRTKNIDRRLARLQQKHGQDLALVKAIEHFHASDTELLLHDHFCDKRLDGEWFCLDAKDLERFELYAGIYEKQTRVTKEFYGVA